VSRGQRDESLRSYSRFSRPGNPLFTYLNFPAFYGTRRFITMFTTAHHWLDESCPHHTTPLSLRYILILSSHIHLRLPSDLLSSGFPNETLIHCSMTDYTHHQTSIYSNIVFSFRFCSLPGIFGETDEIIFKKTFYNQRNPSFV
jgi:hypothetical protein